MRSDIRRKRKKSRIIAPVLVLILAAVLVFGFLFYKDKLDFFKNGKLIYGDNLTEEETKLIGEIVPEDKKLSKDLKIDGKYLDEFNDQEDAVLMDIVVPVTDFYSEKNDIKKEDLDNAKLVSINDLNPSKKLLSIDGKYYLDNFKDGARYRVLSIKSVTKDGEEENVDSKDAEVSEIIEKLKEKAGDFPKESEILSINQTGVTALTRKLQIKLNEVKDATYFAENIQDFLKSTDLTHISNEVSFADNCTTDAATTTLCADPRMMDVIEAIGTDIVELTGNHNNDWSKEMNKKTIETYKKSGLKTFGGGKNEKEAKKPLELDEKNTKITWIGVNKSTSTKENGQGATEKNPGANIYDEKTVKSQIESAKSDGKFVIVDVQFFECYSYPERGTEMPSCDAPIENQKEFFRSLVDFGADLVVGTSAHQPQTYELYKNTPIYYGLGNLFFDQTAWPGTTRSLVLTHYFKDGKLIQTRISPTSYDSTFKTTVMNEAATKTFIKRLLNSSPKGR